MATFKESPVTDARGARGYAQAAGPEHGEERVLLRFGEGRALTVPAALLRPDEAGGYLLPYGFDELEARQGGEIRIPVIAEEARVRKVARETGGVRIAKRVHQKEEQIDVPLVREEIEVSRVPVNRVVEAAVPVRQEGDLTVIPVLEEVLVVEKRLVLKEEVHIRRKRTERHEPQTVVLREEEVEVERNEVP